MSSPALHIGHARMLRLSGVMRSASKALSEDLVSAEWHSVTAVKAAAERPIAGLMLTVWADQRREVMRKLGDVLADLGVDRSEAKSLANRSLKRGPELDPLLVEALLDISTWDAVLLGEMEPLLLAVLEEGFRTGALRVSLTSNFEISARTQSVLDEVLLKTKGINTTTASDVGSQIAQGLRDNESIADITRRIEQYFDGIETWRAQQIAQTSATPAFEVSQQEAFVEAGIEDNTWLTQRDGVVRAEHAALDGETVRIGEAFSNGLLYPGDPAGSAADVINCRCSLLPGSPESKALHLLPTDESADDRKSLIQSAYPSLRDEHGQIAALEMLADRFHVSERTVRRDLWE